MNKISYYDLLGLIQREQEPKRISVSLTYGTSGIYKAEYDDGEFSHYLLDKKLQNETYRFYLGECLLESSMFDKCITILDVEDEFEDIKEITQECFDNWTCAKHINQLIKNQKKIIERIKEEGK